MLKLHDSCIKFIIIIIIIIIIITLVTQANMMLSLIILKIPNT